MKIGGVKIGKGTEINSGAQFIGQDIEIGDNCFIGVNTVITSPVRIGNHCGISREVLIITGGHHTGSSRRRSGKGYKKMITIGNGTVIYARTVLVEGVSVGDGCVIGACSLVIRDVPSNTFVAGVPAKFIKELPLEVPPEFEDPRIAAE